jgi:hypothetical protein
MAINVNLFEDFVVTLVSFAAGAKHRDFVTGLAERTRLLPHPTIEGDRQIFDDDEDLVFHARWPYSKP